MILRRLLWFFPVLRWDIRDWRWHPLSSYISTLTWSHLQRFYYIMLMQTFFFRCVKINFNPFWKIIICTVSALQTCISAEECSVTIFLIPVIFHNILQYWFPSVGVFTWDLSVFSGQWLSRCMTFSTNNYILVAIKWDHVIVKNT